MGIRSTLRPVETNSDVSRSQEELGAVVIHEGGVPSTYNVHTDLSILYASVRDQNELNRPSSLVIT